MTADLPSTSDVELEIDKVGELSSLSPRGCVSLDAGAGNNLAPPPRRKSFSRLRRRLSQTFRFSLNGSMAELSGGGFNSGTFGERQEKSNGLGRMRGITSLTRRLSLTTPRSLTGAESHHSFFGVVHEHPRIGSDGESEEGSGTGSEDTNISPGSQDSNQSQNELVKMRQKPLNRKISKQEEISKRLSLPADLRLPENFVTRQTVSPTLEGPTITRATRRQSLSEIGFGRIDTYTKLDKLGEGTYATVFKGKSRLTLEIP
jgi:hypothetical protein